MLKNMNKKSSILSKDNSLLDYYEKDKFFLENPDSISSWISLSLSHFLDCILDDFVLTSDFKFKLQKSCLRLLTISHQKKEKVVFFHELIPGFTVLVIKKIGWGIEEGVEDQAHSVPKMSENDLKDEREKAVQSIIHSYISRTNNRVLLLEGLDILFVFFPVTDIRRNFIEMGFYETEMIET